MVCLEGMKLEGMKREREGKNQNFLSFHCLLALKKERREKN